uniref:(California timema) hypothetical protein n=1 Tax=Timema californicum TaxID=61474 RepID=A0A7R9P7P1_TIMCA|nr:unnamed protein product [Timema californicum]
MHSLAHSLVGSFRRMRQLDEEVLEPLAPWHTLDRTAQTSPSLSRKDSEMATQSIALTPKSMMSMRSSHTNELVEDQAPGWKEVRKKVRKKQLVKQRASLIVLSNALVIRANEGKSYADILRKVKQDVSEEKIGDSIQKIRRTNTGQLLIVLIKKSGSRTDKLRRLMTDALKEDAKVLSKVQEVDLEIGDIEETATKREVADGSKKRQHHVKSRGGYEVGHLGLQCHDASKALHKPASPDVLVEPHCCFAPPGVYPRKETIPAWSSRTFTKATNSLKALLEMEEIDIIAIQGKYTLLEEKASLVHSFDQEIFQHLIETEATKEDQINEEIDEDKELDHSDKYEYLIQATLPNSKARDIVDSFPATGENYPKAIQKLKSCFGKDSLLLEVYTRELLSLMNANIVPDVSYLYDKIETHLSALESLKVTSEKYAAMLIYMIESCLTTDMLRAWQRSAGGKEKEPEERLQSLMKFLEN